nr:MAG TPA: hypothetical protein [Caudoviricetes sp.]
MWERGGSQNKDPLLLRRPPKKCPGGHIFRLETGRKGKETPWRVAESRLDRP